jgi:hypothetical protein
VSIFNDLVLGSRGGTVLAKQLLIQPVIPIPGLKRFPVGQIIRPSIPIVTSPGPDRTTGLGDITLIDIFLPERYERGAWGIGLVLVSPTATDDQLGQENWQIGPPASVMCHLRGSAKSMTTTTARDDLYAFVFGEEGLMRGVGSKITRYYPK